MKKVVKQNNDAGLVTGMPVQRGKIISAIVLVSIMGILWMRVFLSSGGEEVNATVKPQGNTSADAEKKDENKLQYLDLPVTEGRHDMLKRDVFAISESALKLETEVVKPVEKVPLRNEADIVSKAVEGLTIDAIFAGSNDKAAQAYVGNRELKAGSQYTVEHGGESYLLKVKEIHENFIVFEWKNNEYRAVMPGPDTAD